ncbi:MAG TPA: ELWxxDGT repeat protein [Thermoanaerobaculia bacterium]
MRRFAFVPPLVLALAAAATAAMAQPAHQVVDVNTTAEFIADPLFTGQDFAVLGTTVFFLQDDGIHGIELWKTDGTAAGTVLLKDICPGSCWGWPTGLTVSNGVLYFGADDGVHGQELWRSDGTEAGTAMVTDLNPGLPDSSPALMDVAGTLFLAADDGVHGRELWKTDGTAAGTQLVADLNPGPAGSSPRLWLDLGGGKLLLNADDGVHGREPWLSDGTTAGTVLLKDVNPTGDSGYGSPLNRFENDALALGNGAFLFAADDGVHGFEPWVSDGTGAGTTLLADVNPGATVGFNGSFPYGFTRLGSQILFVADDGTTGYELWSTDGTPGGTAQVKDLNPGQGSGYEHQLTALGNRVFFMGYDGATGLELWSTDGTAAGTVQVKDIYPGTGFAFSIIGRPQLKVFNGGLLFFADDGVHGSELWRSDGTAAGTVLVKDIQPGSPSSFGFGFSGLTVVGGTAFFQGSTLAHGIEPWKTDGTEAGTLEVKDVATVTSSMPVFNGYSVSDVLAGKFLFQADDGVSGVEPWLSDGTAAGTFRLADLNPGLNSSNPVSSFPLGGISLLGSDFGLWTTDGTSAGTSQILPGVIQGAGGFVSALGTVLFAAADAAAGDELWKTDGTTAGTSRIRDIAPGAASSYPSLLTPLGSAVLFAAYDGGPGYPKLWRTDGTAAGTLALTTSSITDIRWIVPLGSTALFAADVSGAGQELCVTDGSGGGTHLLKDLRPGAASSDPVRPVRLGSVVVFSAFDDATGQELWASAGTAAGTAPLKDIKPGAGSGVEPSPTWLSGDDQALAGGTFFFAADDGAHGRELWKTDGTAAGTVLVKDIFPGARSADLDQMTVAAGRLFFVADDGVHGRELWVSDGTAAGTRMVADIVAGAGSPVIRNVTAVGHVVVFSADDGVHGRELWRSNGTTAGTFLEQDLAPGTAASSPTGFTAVGTSVFFTANDNVTGFEPWVISKGALLTTFQDVPVDFWAWRFIEALTLQGVTSGCAAGQFCPGALVSRAQMAVLLLGARGDAPPPPATGTRFQDVPAGYWAGPWIEQLAAEGIVGGCSASPPLYCPESTLTRAEMAVLLVGARHETPPPATGTRFADVPAGYWAARWIEQLAADGITSGCGGGNFCPDQPITRAEMAVFLVTAFNLSLP